ncbi:Sugar-transfer associated ATP-grasp [Desulfonatronum zhilinae]|nr:Sugar-transfer associated ATP-grasp [Desulfonatronum zhilinae]
MERIKTIANRGLKAVRQIYRIRKLFSLVEHRKIHDLAKSSDHRVVAMPRKSTFRRYLELLFIDIRWGELSILYFLQDVDLIGKKITKNYFPYSMFKSMREAKNRTKPYDYICLLQDKLLFERYFSAAGIQTVQSIGEMGPGLNCDFGPSGQGAVLDFFSQHPDYTCLFCKPRFGIKGKGAFKFEARHGKYYVNNKKAEMNELMKLVDSPFLCQPFITQHEDIDRLHPQSINTLRVITFRHGDNVNVFLTYLRIGGGGSMTDNNENARAVVGVNQDTGQLNDVGLWVTGDSISEIFAHKTSNVIFSGCYIPFFSDALDLARKAHEWTPGLYSVGWDVAFTPDGVVLVEGNDDWGAIFAMWVMRDFKETFLQENSKLKVVQNNV